MGKLFKRKDMCVYCISKGNLKTFIPCNYPIDLLTLGKT